MKALLVYPKFPVTYWGMQYAMPVSATRAVLPPLGLATLAAQLPDHWQLRLVDLNIEPLADEAIRWADAVLVGGMRVQADSIHEVIARARALGRPTVVGGPAPTTSPSEYRDAEVIFQGESEGRIGALIEALASARPGECRVVAAAAGRHARPPIAGSPLPRFDLLDLSAYSCAAIQYSRGCPFNCEFCDIIEIFGRVPRLKTNEQVIAELDEIYRLGFRGALFIVDDNFIGNRAAVRTLLPVIARWQRDRGYPFELFTEASVNLAADARLVSAMVAAGFSSVLVGIETPSDEALAGVGGRQNTGIDLAAAVRTLTAAGLEVMGGFIVGFDQDDASAFEAQDRFISALPIPLAMVGLLSALPGTALWRRLEREGRLRSTADGDTFARQNFEPAMDERALLSGYARLLSSLYTAEAYYARCRAFLDQAAALPGGKRFEPLHYLKFVRAVVRIGILSPRRWHFWRLLHHAARYAPHNFPWAVGKAASGEHMIRYTEQHVLPRIEDALREVDTERARRQSGGSDERQPAASSCRTAA